MVSTGVVLVLVALLAHTIIPMTVLVLEGDSATTWEIVVTILILPIGTAVGVAITYLLSFGS